MFCGGLVYLKQPGHFANDALLLLLSFLEEAVVPVREEVVSQGRGVDQALNDHAHEAGVAKVHQAYANMRHKYVKNADSVLVALNS